jgi:segregation and condensation protein B
MMHDETDIEDIEADVADTDLAEVEAAHDEDAHEEGGESFSLQSPEMVAKIQIMHESMTLKSQLEAAIFASPTPVRAEDLLHLVSHKISVDEIEAELQSLKRDYDEKAGGFSLECVKSLGYQFQSNPVAAPIMAKMFASRPRPLSRAALETAAIIAYRQPCTRAAIEFIRGVDAGSIIKNLLERGLIRCVGRKEDAGRPMLFGTTDEFLQVFGIGSIKDLPPLSAFQPSSDTMRDSLKELDAIDQVVAVEDFVADDSEVLATTGEGLQVEDAVQSTEDLVIPPESTPTAELDLIPQNLE